MCLLPGVVGAMVALMVGVATGLAIYQRHVGERTALHDAIALGLERGIELDRVAYAFANSRRDVLGQRAYRFAQYLQAGFAADQAAPAAGLKLTPNLRSSLARLHPSPQPPGEARAPGEAQPTREARAGGLYKFLPVGADDEEGAAASPIWLVGAFYFIAVISLATLAVTQLITPMMLLMFEEFGLVIPPGLIVIRSAIEVLPGLCLLLFLIFGAIGLLWALLHAGVIVGGRWLPILGPYYRSRYDAQALDWLAAAIAADQSLDVLEQELRRARIGPAETRLWRALKSVREGVDWPQSLHRAGLVSRRTLPWVAVTQGGPHLARALHEAAAARRRLASERLKMGLRIAGPIGLGIASIPVWLCGLLMIGMLALLIEGMA